MPNRIERVLTWETHFDSKRLVKETRDHRQQFQRYSTRDMSRTLADRKHIERIQTASSKYPHNLEMNPPTKSQKK